MKWMGNSEKFEYIKGWFRTQYLGWTNCVCDLFQPLRDLKAPKALDSEVKHSRSHMSLGLDPILKRLSLGSSYAWPLLPWSRVFELVKSCPGSSIGQVGWLVRAKLWYDRQWKWELSNVNVHQFHWWSPSRILPVKTLACPDRPLSKRTIRIGLYGLTHASL